MKKNVRLEYTDCIICGSGEHEVAFRKHGYDVVRCKRCGFVYMNPLPEREEVEGKYLTRGFRPKEERIGRRLKYRFLVRLIEHYAKKRGEFLDIGCSIGDFGIALQGRPRWRYHGIDLNPGIPAHNVRKLHISIGTLQDHRFRDGQFAAVTMWHVLEHIRDPRAALSEVHRVLRNDGLLALIVPDVSHHRARYLKTRWKYLGPPDHLWYFAPRSLHTLLEAAGLSVVFTWRSWFKTHLIMFARKPRKNGRYASLC